MILFVCFFIGLATLVCTLWWLLDRYLDKSNRQRALEKYGDGKSFEIVSVRRLNCSAVQARLVEKRKFTSDIYFPSDIDCVKKGTLVKGINNTELTFS